MAEAAGRDICEDCTERIGIWFCTSCGCDFCDECWDRQLPHRKGKKGETGIAHEKTNKSVAKRLEEILTPPSDPFIQRQLHEDDVNTAWFGMVRSTNSQPALNDYGRYSVLMQESSTGQWPERWPQIVSFIGQTGDGKSTLIKMLVDKQSQALDQNRRTNFQTPVVGAINSNTPTSGDVHLYADPKSFYEQRPRLYADCEGLNGGEAVPFGDRTNVLQSQMDSAKATLKPKERHGLCKKGWDIKWADAQTTKLRERAVGHLYPRFLYTFSNVVVFVLRNERTFEATALNSLLEWASRSIEGSVNQPALPHAIVVLNACDHLVPEHMYDVHKSTESLFTNIDSSLDTNSALSRYVEFWRKNGRVITSTKELICCYYSSFRVIRVPAKGRYKLLDDQVAKLHDEIESCCTESHRSRRNRRLDLNADELADSLDSGFAHFSSNLDQPFDFVEMSWNLNPIPRGFGGNILRLALAIKESGRLVEGSDIFAHLGPMVASCIMLDYSRHRIKGTPQQLLKHYRPSLDRALDEFCEAWWPCDYRQRNRLCVNTQRGHTKGHQDANGKLFGTGIYQSSFIAEDYRPTWHHILTQNLEKFRRLSDRNSISMAGSLEIRSAASHHSEQMTMFYQQFNDLSQFSSHSACFCCIRELPEYPLPCGHVLCSACIQAFGKPVASNTWSLDHCPLHVQDRPGWDIRISMKPKYAGVRILTLDGGGMRGIIELQVLTAIQRKLGGLPVQSFFDLIVGTSTGGIIALGLGVKEWSVHDCMQKFKDLCYSAFTPREFSRIPILKQLVILHHRAKYRTQPLERVLKESLGEELLFGGNSNHHRPNLKVAVTSTTESGQGPSILCNYNRPQSEQKRMYRFERPERVSSEFRVWEAARATSAAPSYFKSFSNPRTNRVYLDGALYHNNPVLVANEERKIIWPDVCDQPPDLILSIGTGRSKKAIEREQRLLERKRSGLPVHVADDDSIFDVPRKVMGLKLPQFLKVFQDRMTSILDAQEAWDQFCRNAPTYTDRCMRVNIDVEDLPTLDDTDQLASLDNEARSALRGQRWTQAINNIVLRLLASSFYFKKATAQFGPTSVIGQIMCKFEDDPRKLGQLARVLESFKIGEFRPHFRVMENYDQQWSKHHRVIPLGPDVLLQMQRPGIFELPQITVSSIEPQAETMIELCFESDRHHMPISGFPRKLGYEDELYLQRERDRQFSSHFRPDSGFSQDNSSGIAELGSESHIQENISELSTMLPDRFPDSSVYSTDTRVQTSTNPSLFDIKSDFDSMSSDHTDDRLRLEMGGHYSPAYNGTVLSPIGQKAQEGNSSAPATPSGGFWTRLLNRVDPSSSSQSAASNLRDNGSVAHRMESRFSPTTESSTGTGNTHQSFAAELEGSVIPIAFELDSVEISAKPERHNTELSSQK